ncbi:unnamed protein product [Rotaria sordida]|uniref:Phosphatidate phosphatase APP1 catalytic domain-containing protein n=1 Tax=Rotaria sordida TaxID=392033 RepID=A0A814E0H5_9BILA|nr:unnamed protein product [Rotaria sordida]
MYCILRLIFIIFFVDSIKISHLFQDKNPFTTNKNDTDSSGNPKKKFMLIPSIGYEMNDKPGKFTFILNGWYYKPVDSGFIKIIIKTTLQAALSVLDSSSTSNEEIEQERIEPFFVTDVTDHKIKLKLTDSISEIVSTDKNGRFYKDIIVDSLNGLNIQKQELKYTAFDNDNQQNAYEGIIYLMKNKNRIGCLIISDIDDTIKISEVPFKTKLMINTFRKPFQAVPGMSQAYRSWESSDQCSIHYVSAMPSQLYYATQTFLNKENFPGGSFHMRHLKLADSDKLNLINSIIDFVKHDASRKHKISVIENILTYASIKQKFVMVGDSGELDPEIYGEIARKYPDRIKMIFIRIVPGGKNNNSRFEIAFRNVRQDKWKTFSDATELPKKLYNDTNSINESGGGDGNIHSVYSNNTNILSTSLFYIIISVLLTLIYF